MVKWSTGFYTSFDTLVKVAKGKFFDVDLINLKVEDYADAGSEVGSPMSMDVEWEPLEVTMEEGSSSQLAVLALPMNSPSPVLEIFLADPIVANPFLVSVD